MGVDQLSPVTPQTWLNREDAWAIGDDVYINTPENSVAHGRVGVIKCFHSWGVYLTTNFGSGEFRCLWSEITLNDPLAVHTNTQAKPRNTNYEMPGIHCEDCGSEEFTRSGTCLVCVNCGKTTGGCS